MDTVETRVTAALRDIESDIRADDALVSRLIRDARSADTPPPVPKQRSAWFARMLAAAAVVLVASGAVLLANRASHPSQPTHPGPSATRSPSTPTPKPHGRSRFTPLACTVDQPAAWQHATSPIVEPPGWSAQFTPSAGLSILDMSANGDVLAYSDVGDGAVVLVRPDGHRAVLYALPRSLGDLHDLRVGTGRLSGRRAVFDIVIGDGEVSTVAIEAVDLSTGSSRTVWQAQPGNDDIVSDPQMRQGDVYWSEVTTRGYGHVYRYDLATGARRTVASGTVIGLQTVGGAVEWTQDGKVEWAGTPDLPPGYAVRPGKDATLLRDGSVYAWPAWTGTGRAQKLVIEMAVQGMSRPEIVYSPPDANTYPTLLALSGPYVIFDDRHETVALDTRTGASTDLTDSREPFTDADADGGVIAVNVVGAKGGAQLVLVKSGDLTELHC